MNTDSSLPASAAAAVDSMDLAALSVRVATLSMPIAGVDVCGGRIGVDRVKFCSAGCPAGGASCGKHNSHNKKADITIPAYYIQVPGQSHAYLQPCLSEPVGGFGKVILSSISGSRPVSEWIEIFTALNGIEFLSEAEQVDIISRFDNTVYQLKIGPTPIKPRPTKRLLDDMEDGDGGVGSTGSWSLGSRDQPQVLEANSSIEGSIAHIIANWDGVVRATQRQRQSTDELEYDMKEMLVEVDNKVIKVASMVGSVIPPSAPAPTVWSSIGAHSVALNEHVQMWHTGREKLEDGIRMVSDEVSGVKQTTQQIVPIVHHLTSSIEDIQRANMSMGVQGGMAAGSVVEILSLKQEMVRMMQQMGSMAHEIEVLKAVAGERNQTAADHVFGFSAEGEENVNLRVEVGLLKEEVRVVQHELLKMRSETNSEIIEFGGFTFHAQESYVQWVATHLKSGYYGFCYDFVSLLECHSSQNWLSSQGIKSRESIVKAGYADQKLAIIDQSFGCTFPEIFGDELDQTNPSKKMGSIKTAADWENPAAHSGLKNRIDIFLTAYKKNVEGQITGMLHWNSTAGIFFTQMMQHNIKFWDTMSSWVTRFERELTHRAGGDDPKMHQEAIWNLICWMIHSMFIEMNVRRSPGTGMVMMENEVDDTKIHKCAMILQGALAAHKFMAELIKADFIRHPIFASTMDEFLLTNKAAHATVEYLLAKVKRLEVDVKSAQVSADEAIFFAIRNGGGGRGGGGGNGGRGNS